MPTAIPVTLSSMNYASVVFLFFASVSVLCYAVSGRKSFTGPPSDMHVEHDGEVAGGLGRVTPEQASRCTYYGNYEGKIDSIK